MIIFILLINRNLILINKLSNLKVIPNAFTVKKYFLNKIKKFPDLKFLLTTSIYIFLL